MMLVQELRKASGIASIQGEIRSMMASGACPEAVERASQSASSLVGQFMEEWKEAPCFGKFLLSAAGVNLEEGL
jgi:hypothetical protein